MSGSGADVRADFLVEVGTEELPPAALQPLMQAFADSLDAALAEARLAHDGVVAFASPRRLAVKVTALAGAQPEREVEHRGPPTTVAFDADGEPTRAARAFAAKCNVSVDALQRDQTDKGEWLVHRTTETGLAAAGILGDCVERALASLPVPRRMRWGSHDTEFVRPVHWIVMLHGTAVVPGRMYGIDAGRVTHGHRFMGADAIELASPADYPKLLEERGHVIADFAARRGRIVADVTAAARAAGGEALGATHCSTRSPR
ncbi:MAG: glycine--tRNA ligase subunit beta [Woeseiaceae bacterium]|nr:glycine--tRNA ligase subunit beta [Woeseiaceae bacterium]